MRRNLIVAGLLLILGGCTSIIFVFTLASIRSSAVAESTCDAAAAHLQALKQVCEAAERECQHDRLGDPL